MDNRNARTVEYDVVIVGGGVAGATVALLLSRAGKRVLILEAGSADALDPEKYRSYLTTYYTMGGLRGTPNGPYPINKDAASPGASNLAAYYVQNGPMQFMSDYLRMLGGSTLHWQGTSLRMLPNDFKMRTAYGRGSDWPISYDDLEAAYRQAEFELGVAADVEDQRMFGAWFPEGYVYPMHRMPQSIVDQFFARAIDGKFVEISGESYPLKVVSIPVARNSTPNPAYTEGRGYEPTGSIGNRDAGNRCQGNSNCLPLCPVQAKYNALKTLSKALESGCVEVRPRCVATRLSVDPDSGRIAGVAYKHYADPEQISLVNGSVTAHLVVLASNAIQNAVLMLASGVRDESDQLGRNLMDHPYVAFYGLAPESVWPFRGPDTTSGLESLRDGDFRKQHASFRASLANWGWSGEPSASVSMLLSSGLFGKPFRDALRDRMTRMVKLGFMLEQLPDPNNRVTIDPAHLDALGNYNPVLNYSYSDYSLDGALTALEVVWPAVTAAAKISDRTKFPTPAPAGYQQVLHNGVTLNFMGSGHVVGTHRMGASRGDSVVDHQCRVWNHPNLFAVGAGSMVTIGTSNPTLTAVALSIMAAKAMIEDLK